MLILIYVDISLQHRMHQVARHGVRLGCSLAVDGVLLDGSFAIFSVMLPGASDVSSLGMTGMIETDQ